MAQRAVQQRGLSIRAACQAFRISQACYRYEARRDTEDEEIAQWLLRPAATTPHRATSAASARSHQIPAPRLSAKRSQAAATAPQHGP